MTSSARILSLCCMAGLAPMLASAELAGVKGPRREEVREAVAEHRASQREQVRAAEAVAGRRLTPAERAELREQLRSQWAGRIDGVQTADTAIAPESMAPATAQPATGWRAFWPWSSTRP